MTVFRRLVLELGHGGTDAAMMREAAAFARLAGVELHALFVEDDTLLRASTLPFAREISVLSHQWRPLRTAQLEADLKAAADQARHRFEAAAQATGVVRHFEVHRGDLAVRMTEICAPEDIVVIASSQVVAAETHLARALRETADHSAASVLFLPPGSGRARGPVVAIIKSADDPSRAVAQRMAEHGRERLIVLASNGDASARTIPGPSVQDIVAALGDTRERLIVITRDSVERGAALAIARGVPVLVVEPV
jgi:hypothetical protein